MRNYLQSILSTILLCTVFIPHPLHGQLTATLQYEYYTESSNYQNITQEIQSNGVVSSQGSQMAVQNSPAFTLLDAFGRYDGCQPTLSPIKYPNGTAIIQRGGDCTFSVKVTRAKQYGAAAVIIYDPQNNGQDVYDMLQNNSDVLALYVQRTVGLYLFDLANDNLSRLNITIEPTNNGYDTSDRGGLWYTSRGAIIFVVVSVCVLICLCISWFTFYFCQRYRLRTSKDRLQNRLLHAAKKALTKIPLVTITENPRVEESCVICLEMIKLGDTVRQLVCGHTFHQHCVDPWLINHRHCPLCNLDILAAYRISIPGTTNNRRHRPDVIPTYYSSLATTAATPIVHNNEQAPVFVQMPIPTISGSIKDGRHGEENSSFRTDDDRH